MERTAGASLVAIVLAFLGAVAIPLNVATFLNSEAGEPALGTIGVAYGILALVTARHLWGCSPNARGSYLAWAGTVLAYFLTAVGGEVSSGDLFFGLGITASVLLLIYGTVIRPSTRAA